MLLAEAYGKVGLMNLSLIEVHISRMDKQNVGEVLSRELIFALGVPYLHLPSLFES